MPLEMWLPAGHPVRHESTLQGSALDPTEEFMKLQLHGDPTTRSKQPDKEGNIIIR